MTLDFTTFQNLIHQPCAYCGALPQKTEYARCPTIEVNGIDRRNNRSGYTAGNCVPCCPDCNWAKSSKTKSEFLSHVYKICDYLLKSEKRTGG